MYICNCGKGFNLSDEQYALVPEKELRLKHDCGFDIVIGGEDLGPYDEETSYGGVSMYSYDTKDIKDEEHLAELVEITVEPINIRMKCGHDANWRGATGSLYCHKECAWDENGRQKDSGAWEQDHEFMYPDLFKES